MEHQTVDYRYTQDRELSWLRFNERVLDEAKEESVPLLERIKFAAIFTSNLDEFFMVRVGSLSDLALLEGAHIDNKSGKTPSEQLSSIFKAVVPLYKQRDKVVEQLEGRMRTCNICRMSMGELDNKAKKQVEAWFKDEILPVLSPQVVDLHHPFPHLPNKNLNIALSLRMGGKDLFGIIPLPQTLPRYYLLKGRSGIHYVLLEDVLLEYADRVFDRFAITDKAVVAVTRNADISPEDEAFGYDEDFRKLMQKVIKKRGRLAPVRLEVQGGSKGDKLITFLCQRLNLPKDQVFVSKAPLRLDYVFDLPGLLPPESRAALCDTPYTPRYPTCLNPQEPVTPQVLRHDVLLFYPYEQMEPFLQLIREAAFDPNVLSIRITIYRLATKAKLAEYLSAAAENGKDVTVLMELRARFDEQNNIDWAQRMEEAGCTILYGSEGIKVHSKICLITRREKGKLQYITQVGTGNYNEKTAALYTDLCLITANQEIGADAAALFQNMAVSNFQGSYQQLLASPFGLRDKVMELIDGEIAKGQEGYLFMKLNSITDRKIIDKLVQASQAGVKIDLNVRGICCLVPGIPGLTENITVFSIVGRYLEHARIYRFGKGEDAALYISSADFMTRNTERRVEIACPVLDPKVRARVLHIISELLLDNVKARELTRDGSYRRRGQEGIPFCCQEYFQVEDTHPYDPPQPYGGRTGKPRLLERWKKWREKKH